MRIKRFLGLMLGAGVVLFFGTFPAFALGLQSVVSTGAGPASSLVYQGKILGIAASVFAILQGIKSQFPAISGVWSVVLNIAVSSVGVVVLVKPEDLFSLPTLTAIILAGIGAAGIHGTTRAFTSGADASGVAPGSSSSTFKALVAVFCIGLVLSSGCAIKRNAAPSTPAEVQATLLLQGANTVDAVANAVAAANDTVNGLEASEPDYYRHVKPLLKTIAQKNEIAIAAIEAAQRGDTSVDWRGSVVAIAAGVTPQDLTSFGFKNANSRDLAAAGLKSLVGLLQSIPRTFAQQ